MEKISLTTKVPATRREWALFGLRLVIPMGLLLCLFSPANGASHALAPILIVGLVALISNLFVAMALVSGSWSRLYTLFTIMADIVLSVAAVAASSPGLLWVGLVPVSVAGLYFDWLAGLIAGVVVAAGMVGAQLIPPGISGDVREVNLPILIMGVVILLAAGPIAALLSQDVGTMTLLQNRLRDRGKQARQISRLANEYMRVVYEMAEVMSASKLDPKRVLSSALSFGLDGLERVGVQPPLYGAILLFADMQGGLGTVLRVAQTSASVPLSDRQIVLPGAAGAVAEVLNTMSPRLTRTPAEDVELAQFESFGACNTALCLPLRSGDESYGVMLIGSPQEEVFTELHVELMQAVANQAAASLHNTRIYASLVEQRDRVLGIERSARAQLASELHDGPTQGVAAITMRLNYIRKLIEKKPETAVGELYQVEDLARRTTKEIRHMLFELRPKALDQGLESGLHQLVIKLKETYDQDIQLMIAPGADRLLDTQTTQTLFSIVNETLTNSRKHAKANQTLIRLDVREDTLCLEVSDNGVGFDVEEALARARQREGHLGLINLQERAALTEGTLHIESEPGKGTKISVLIPLEVLRLRRSEEAERMEQEPGVVARPATNQ